MLRAGREVVEDILLPGQVAGPVPVVAELAAGASGQGTGLAYRIVEAGFRLDIPRMFAALALISLAGLAIYGALAALSYYLLRGWHESARERDD